MRITRFADYDFPDAPLQFSTNFSDLVPRTDRLPGMDGGFDEFGMSPAPQEIGRVTFSFWLREANAQALADARDDVRGLARAGVRKLYMTTGGSVDADRWTRARVNNIQDAVAHLEFTREDLRMTLDWQVSDPRWVDAAAPEYDEGYLYDDGNLYDSGAFGTAVSGTATSFTLTRGGNAPVYPIIVIKAAAGGTVSDPTIERYENGNLIESLALAGTATSGRFTIDCEGLSATVNGVDAYADVTASMPWWMRLEPGDNSLKVLLQSGQSGTVWFCYQEAWY